MNRWEYDWINDLNITSILDIGACSGQFASSLRSSNKDWEITCVEPNPYCISKLRNMKKRNEIVDYHNIGLGNKKEILKLFLLKTKTKSKSSSFYKPTQSENIEYLLEEVQVETMDDFFKDYIFDLIKIDTQGNEYPVILGGKEILKKANYIIIEFQTVSTNINAPESILAVKELETIGFKINSIVEENKSAYLKNRNSVHLDILFTKQPTHNKECLKDYEEYFKEIL